MKTRSSEVSPIPSTEGRLTYNPTHMKALIALTFLLTFGWLVAVTFYGPELYRAINGPEPVKAKVIRRAR